MSHDVKQLAKARGLSPTKALGQNFLTDPNIIRKIAEIVLESAPNRVIEIGPGLGSLTRPLADSGVELLAVEKDRKLIPVLEELFASDENVRVEQGDATTFEFANASDAPDERPAIAGNLPYSVTTPLLLNIHAQRDHIRSATVMIQKEVADRLAAEPSTKAYGSLSVLFQLCFDVTPRMTVSPGCFWPRPDVTSTVLSLAPLPAPRHPVEDLKMFERVLRAAFSQRRKTLRNALSSQFEKALVQEAAQRANIDLGLRAEVLTVSDFARLGEAFSSCLAEASS